MEYQNDNKKALNETVTRRTFNAETLLLCGDLVRPEVRLN